MNEHSNIVEGNSSNIQDNKEELPKDMRIIPGSVENDVAFLIPKKFFQKTLVHHCSVDYWRSRRF